MNRTQYFIQEKGAIIIRANYHCEICGKHLPNGGDFAHRLGNKKRNEIKYGWLFLDNRNNGLLTCPQALGCKCNEKADIGNKEEVINRHVKYVYSMMGGCDE